MYKVTYYFVVPRGVRRGTGFSKSPKEAFKQAIIAADAAFEGCESIGAEGFTMWKDGVKVTHYCDL